MAGKKKILAIFSLVLLFSILSLNFAFGNSSDPKFYPTDDSYVNIYNPSSNYGSKSELYIGRDSGTKRTYLKFNISNLVCDGIAEASLNLYRNSGQNDYVAAYKTSEYYKDSTEPWKESGITWKNAPTDFEFLDSVLVNSNGYKTWNITSAAQNAFNGDKIVSIALKFLNESGSSATQIFSSKERACISYDPYLEIFCTKYECKSDEECKPNYCSKTYQDYCNGRKLVEYDYNKILDNTTVENSCNNTCQESHTCTNCTPDCSPPKANEYCVRGVCDAECDEENKCGAKIENNTCYYDDKCDLESCSCNYSNQEFCPDPGTVSEGLCFWGERDCSNDSGCSLNKTLMELNNYCDPLNGPKDTEPPIPPMLYASANGNSITLTWENASDNIGIDHFIIYRSVDSAFTDISGSLSSNQSSLIDSGLEYSKTYYYMIGVFDASSNSANSTVANATTGSKPQEQPAPQPSEGGGMVGSVSLYCKPNWSCTVWGECKPEGFQTRKCTDLSNCGDNSNKPNETQSCIYTAPAKICEENWNCTKWSECINKTRTRICTDLNNCNTTSSKPIEMEECEEEKPKGAPLGITGMLAAFFLNPAYAILMTLTVLAIILTVLNIKLSSRRKKK